MRRKGILSTVYITSSSSNDTSAECANVCLSGLLNGPQKHKSVDPFRAMLLLDFSHILHFRIIHIRDGNGLKNC